jgi:hypothetical protein
LISPAARSKILNSDINSRHLFLRVHLIDAEARACGVTPTRHMAFRLIFFRGRFP